MLYKIESIKHSGTCGKRGTERTDGIYPFRIGRVVKLNIDDIEIEYPLVIRYVKDSDGTPMRYLVLRTSFVKSFEYSKDKNGEITCINVETENSIYEFKKVNDE